MLLLLLATSAHAQATIQNCFIGDAPRTHVSFGNNQCMSVCIADPDDNRDVQCTIPNTIDQHTSNMFAVHGFGSNDVTVWGADEAGARFCCTINDATNDFDNLNLYGTDRSNEIQLVYGSYQLENYKTTDGLKAAVYALGDDDTLIGSPFDSIGSSNLYYERFDGGDGDDTIRTGPGESHLVECGDGDDYVDAETSKDLYVLGESGADEIYVSGPKTFVWAGDGNDYVEGGAGIDNLYGEDFAATTSSDDKLVGGSGDDLLDGGAGSDGLYGQGGTDALYGQAGDDRLCPSGFGVLVGEVQDGGSGTDRCLTGSGTTTGCETPIIALPCIP